MLRKILLAAAAFAMTSTVAAAATTYDPAAEGPNATHFQFGYIAGGVFTAYSYPGAFTAGGCLGSATTSCLTGGPSAYLGAYFDSVDGVANTAFLHAADVTLHPGANGEQAAVAFIAPTAGSYRFTGFFRGVDAPNGNGVTFATPGGAGVMAPGGTQSFDLTTVLGAGQKAFFSVGNNGSYAYDTTGLNLSAAAVPEPATWAMMITGLALIGGAVRSANRKAGLNPTVA
jgi:hypothetical protein